MWWSNFNHAGNQAEIAITYRARMAKDLPDGVKRRYPGAERQTGIYLFQEIKIVKPEDPA